jgi:hypothetical protein
MRPSVRCLLMHTSLLHLQARFRKSRILSKFTGPTGSGVAANLGLDSTRERPPASHPPHIGLEQGIAGQLAGAAAGGAEERRKHAV